MDAQWLQENWALAGALGVLTLILAVALLHWRRSTGRGQLRRALRELRVRRRALRRAAANVAAAQHRAERLQLRVERVKPRHLEEAHGAVADARGLAKIAHDRLLVAENHVRRIIVQEFPPAKQARLRARYHVGEQPDRRPFTF